MATADTQNYAQKLGIAQPMVVQELGWDEDTDDGIRADIEDAIGAEMVDDETNEVVDAVLLWWREGDGDLADELMGIVGPLANDGFVWVLTPKTGHPGYVDQSEIAEAAETAGLTSTSAVTLGGWFGTRVVQPKMPSKQR
ncbi:DUF3052 domain-containing protein [Streptomyces sp. NPDC001233]